MRNKPLKTSIFVSLVKKAIVVIMLVLITINFIEMGTLEASETLTLPVIENISTETTSDNLVLINNLQDSKTDKFLLNGISAFVAPDYIIYAEGSQIYAKNGITGKIKYNSTSAHTTIQNALNDLENGGKVFLIDGEYIITSTISVPSNVVFEGQSWNTVIKLADSANVNVIDAKLNGKKNIVIRNLQIDGNRENQTLLYSKYNLIGLNMEQVKNSTFENLFVKNTAGFGIVAVSSQEKPSKLIIRNIIVNNTGGDGIYFRSYSGLIDNVLVSNYGDTGIVLSGCKNCALTNSMISGGEGDGFDAVNISRSSQKVSIIGNVIQNSTRSGIHFASLSPDKFSGIKVLIDGNFIVNSASNGILLSHDASEITISNNVILQNGKDGIVIPGKNTRVIGNIIGKNEGHGVNAYNSMFSKITENLIYNNGRKSANSFDGINIGGSSANDILILNNLITDNQNFPTQRFGIKRDSGSNIKTVGNSVDKNIQGQISVTNLEIPFKNQFLRVNESVYMLPEYEQKKEIKISGHIVDYKRGTGLNLKIIKPDNTIDEQVIRATKDGYFDTRLYLKHDSLVGVYKISAIYYDVEIDSFSFEVLSDEDAVLEKVIPIWIKNAAKWWSEGYISDSDFGLGVDYLLKEKFKGISAEPQFYEQPKKIPDWFRINAKWWADELISERDFTGGLWHLYKLGIIQ